MKAIQKFIFLSKCQFWTWLYFCWHLLHPHNVCYSHDSYPSLSVSLSIFLVVFFNMSYTNQATQVKEDEEEEQQPQEESYTCPAPPKPNRIRPPLPIGRLNKLRRTLFMDVGDGHVHAERSQEWLSFPCTLLFAFTSLLFAVCTTIIVCYF